MVIKIISFRVVLFLMNIILIGNIHAKDHFWKKEGIRCYVSAEPRTGYYPVHRFFNGKDHFYTTSGSEKTKTMRRKSYTYEGIAFYIKKSPGDNHVPFYRLWHPKKDDHYYTASGNVKNILAKHHSYIYEGIIGYVMKTKTGGLVPLYGSYNSAIADHFYTISRREWDKSAEPPRKPRIIKISNIEYEIEPGARGTVWWAAGTGISGEVYYNIYRNRNPQDSACLKMWWHGVGLKPWEWFRNKHLGEKCGNGKLGIPFGAAYRLRIKNTSNYTITLRIGSQTDVKKVPAGKF